jgi:isochorismate synthase
MSARETDIRMGQSVKGILSGLLSKSLSEGRSVSLWQLPGASTKHLIIADSISLVDSNFSLEESAPGFLVSPFSPTASKYYLPADKLFTIRTDSLEQLRGNEMPLDEMKDSQQLFHYTSSRSHKEQARNDFEELVARCLQQIEAGRFEKVVPSRSSSVILPERANLVEIFEKLCTTYPHAFVSLTSSEKYGTWIGASPELLVHIDKNMIFRTTALASTQAFNPGTDLKSVTWNQKEIEEQALVERYIISCFKKIRLREFDEHGPRTVRAGNLLHLKTDFSVDMVATNFPQLGTVMLQLLHPTSAVCGMPLEPALEFLSANEKYDRQLYSGFLGPVNIEGETQVYVNLRCMQVSGSTATLYAGAGVTIDSLPSQEWEETVMKMNTLRQIITS